MTSKDLLPHSSAGQVRTRSTRRDDYNAARQNHSRGRQHGPNNHQLSSGTQLQSQQSNIGATGGTAAPCEEPSQETDIFVVPTIMSGRRGKRRFPKRSSRCKKTVEPSDEKHLFGMIDELARWCAVDASE